jgi:hypothetical protein
MYDSNAGAAVVLTRSGCVGFRIPGQVWGNSNSGELPSATLTNRTHAPQNDIRYFLTSTDECPLIAQAVFGQNAASARQMAAAGKAKRLTLSANVTSAAAKLPH